MIENRKNKIKDYMYTYSLLISYPITRVIFSINETIEIIAKEIFFKKNASNSITYKQIREIRRLNMVSQYSYLYKEIHIFYVYNMYKNLMSIFHYNNFHNFRIFQAEFLSNFFFLYILSYTKNAYSLDKYNLLEINKENAKNNISFDKQNKNLIKFLFVKPFVLFFSFSLSLNDYIVRSYEKISNNIILIGFIRINTMFLATTLMIPYLNIFQQIVEYDKTIGVNKYNMQDLSYHMVIQYGIKPYYKPILIAYNRTLFYSFVFIVSDYIKILNKRA